MVNKNLDVFRGLAIKEIEFVEMDGGVFQLRVIMVSADGGRGYFAVTGM